MCLGLPVHVLFEPLERLQAKLLALKSCQETEAVRAKLLLSYDCLGRVKAHRHRHIRLAWVHVAELYEGRK